MDPRKLKAQLLEQAELQEILTLFEHLPGVFFWIKDTQGRFIANNQAGIHRKAGCATEEDVIGKTDHEKRYCCVRTEQGFCKYRPRHYPVSRGICRR